MPLANNRDRLQITYVLCEFVRRKMNKSNEIKMLKSSIETPINFL